MKNLLLVLIFIIPFTFFSQKDSIYSDFIEAMLNKDEVYQLELSFYDYYEVPTDIKIFTKS